MAKRKYEQMWEILSEYNFNINDELLVDLKCTSCNKILLDAIQCPCGCRFCRKCIVKYLENGPKKCPGTKTECQEEFLSTSNDIQPDHRANRMIAGLIVSCVNENCSFQAEIREIGDHIRMCSGSNSKCLYGFIGCDTFGVSEGTMESHLQRNIVPHSHLMVEWVGNMKNELSESVRRVEVLEELVQQLKETVERQAGVIESQRADLEICKAHHNGSSLEYVTQLTHMEEKLAALSKKINTQDEYIWKVDSMTEKIKEARMGIRAVVYSEPFYTHKYGYKLRLSMHPNGYGYKEGTHLYVLFCVMKGDYDDLLSWPLKQVVTLSIIDRNSGNDHHSFKFSFENTEPSFKGSFMKPTTNMNMAMGNDEFVQLDSLFKYQNLLRDDSILIKCSLSS